MRQATTSSTVQIKSYMYPLRLIRMEKGSMNLTARAASTLVKSTGVLPVVVDGAEPPDPKGSVFIIFYYGEREYDLQPGKTYHLFEFPKDSKEGKLLAHGNAHSLQLPKQPLEHI